MQTHIIEGYSRQGNFGKFLVGRFDHEWTRRSEIPLDLAAPSGRTLGEDYQIPLLAQIGKGPDALMVFDLQTGEGGLFYPGGYAQADLNKHRIWVCPLFEPFLAWLYRQDLADLARLPTVVELDHELELSGYRRRGPDNVPP